MSVVNDTADVVDVTADFFTVGMDGRTMPLTHASGSCRPDAASTLISLAASSIPAGHILVWNYAGSDGSEGRGHHVTGTYKQLELEPSGIALRTVQKADGAHELTLTAEKLALFVLVEASVPGRFSDNAFDMTAGESRVLRFVPERQTEDCQFIIRDLHSCQAAD